VEIPKASVSHRVGVASSLRTSKSLSVREAKLAAANPQGNARDEIVNHLSSNLSVSARTLEGNRTTADLFLHSRLAGSDTTAISLRACFYYLIKTLRVMNKLRQQLEQHQREGRISDPITLEESLQMPYL
jgi:cytochrome P450